MYGLHIRQVLHEYMHVCIDVHEIHQVRIRESKERATSSISDRRLHYNNAVFALTYALTYSDRANAVISYPTYVLCLHKSPRERNGIGH